VRLLVAGSRFDKKELENRYCDFCEYIERILAVHDIHEIVSGGCKNSYDYLAELYASENEIKVKTFPADWDNIESPGAIIKTTKYGGKYNAKAGHDRNMLMGDYAECALILWDGKSKGTKDMITILMSSKVHFIHIVKLLF